MSTSPRSLFVMTLFAFLASAAMSQTLYYNNGTQLFTMNPDTGATTLVAAYSPASSERAMAMHPISGTMYLSSNPGSWNLHTVDLGTAAVTDLGTLSESVRGMVFDSTGKLWAVTGQLSANPHSLISINTGTLATTPENTSLPVERNKLAYDPNTDTVYILGYNSGGGAWELYSFTPSNPTSLTQITLSGDSLNTFSQEFPGMVFDTANNRIITLHEVDGSSGRDVAYITPAGVVSYTSGSFTFGWGLAYDQAATTSEDDWMMY